MCFEVLGFDIFFDEKVKPWLIEVNSLASFATDSQLDKKIKYDCIYEALCMLNLNPKRKKQVKKDKVDQMNRRQFKEPIPSKEDKRELRKKLQAERDQWDLHICTGFKRVYPSENAILQDKYQQMHNQSANLFKDYTSGKTVERAATRGDSKNPVKTNPLPKAKASDLNPGSIKESTP